jgi:hypothetical protein
MYEYNLWDNHSVLVARWPVTQSDYTKSCTHNSCPPEDEHVVARNM